MHLTCSRAQGAPAAAVTTIESSKRRSRSPTAESAARDGSGPLHRRARAGARGLRRGVHEADDGSRRGT